jgi:tyrosyl-tRNA synthetase
MDFEQRYARKELNLDELRSVEIPLSGAPAIMVARVAADAGLAASLTEARRLMAQGGVRVNGEKLTDPKAELGPGEYLIQVGKLKAARARIA